MWTKSLFELDRENFAFWLMRRLSLKDCPTGRKKVVVMQVMITYMDVLRIELSRDAGGNRSKVSEIVSLPRGNNSFS